MERNRIVERHIAHVTCSRALTSALETLCCPYMLQVNAPRVWKAGTIFSSSIGNKIYIPHLASAGLVKFIEVEESLSFSKTS